jgi:hypothetical protein
LKPRNPSSCKFLFFIQNRFFYVAAKTNFSQRLPRGEISLRLESNLSKSFIIRCKTKCKTFVGPEATSLFTGDSYCVRGCCKRCEPKLAEAGDQFFKYFQKIEKLTISTQNVAIFAEKNRICFFFKKIAVLLAEN